MYQRSEASRQAKREYDRKNRQDPAFRERRKAWANGYHRTPRGWAARRVAEVRCRARRLGVEFNLTAADLVLPETCPIFGTKLVIGQGKQSNDSPSVDRIDPRKGYIRGNVIVISQRANSIKREATVEELRRLADFYENLPKGNDQ